MVAGKVKIVKNIHVNDRVRALGEVSSAILGLHYFTGADWGGRFEGISKQTWITELLAAPDL